MLIAHPNLFKIISSIENGNDQEGFSREVRGFVTHLFANAGRSVSRAITRPRSKSKQNLLLYYEGQLSKLAANFAVCSDLALSLGGRLKFEEMISGRFADAFGTLYLGYACLWYYQQNKHVEGVNAIFTIAMESLLQQNQDALLGIAENFPVTGMGAVMKSLSFPFGKVYHGPTDAMRKSASDLITHPSEIRSVLSQGIFVSSNPNDKMRTLLDIFPQSIEVDKIRANVKKTKRSISPEEQAIIDHVEKVVDTLIQVDSYDRLGKEKLMDETYVRPAMLNTKFAHMPAPMSMSRIPVAVN